MITGEGRGLHVGDERVLATDLYTYYGHIYVSRCGSNGEGILNFHT